MVEINQSVCIGCGKCAKDCISRSLIIKNGKAENTKECLLCGHCVAVCPVNAVSIPSYDMEDVEAVSPENQIPVKMLLSTVKARRSIRNYKEKKVEKEKADVIIQAGRYSATACNYQACTFIFVQEKLEQFKAAVWKDVEKAVNDGKKEAEPLAELVKLRAEKGIDYLFRNAPAVMLIAAENLWDAGLAAQNMELAAVSQGLGMLYDGYLVDSVNISDDARAILGVSKPIAASMLLGYPNVEYKRTAPRRKADVIYK